MFDRIRKANPTLHINEVIDTRFKRYGRILNNIDTSGLIKILDEQTQMPQEGNYYKASYEVLEKDPSVVLLAGNVFGGMEIQVGFCNGYGYMLNALEYHKCSEVNLTSTGAVLFLGSSDDICDNRILSSRIEAFYLPTGILIELHPRTLHYAPCRVGELGFKCIVILERGTNDPIERSNIKCSEEDQLLFMKNKWLIAHPACIQVKKNNAYAGIDGENFAIHL